VVSRPAGEARPVGHSVGKSLLARLIRYCLDENSPAFTEFFDGTTPNLPGGETSAFSREAEE
jgi:hypothetical protein